MPVGAVALWRCKLSSPDYDQRLIQLRRSFDEAFEKPPAVDGGAHENLLQIRIGTLHYLLPADALAGLRQAPHVLKVPTRVPAFAGIVRERSQLLPVFDLGALMGGASSKSARWLVLARALPVALSFDAFEGHRRVPSTALLAAPGGPVSAGDLAAGALRVADATVALLNVQTILNRISALGRGPAASEKP